MKTAKPFLLGLEVHDHSIWEVERMMGVIERMKEYGYNTLILHENDLLDSCTQIDAGKNFGLMDLRWKKVLNRLAWLNKIMDGLEEFGAKLYLEVKEPSYHDYILHSFPELIDETGHIDPTSPIWCDLCRKKTEVILGHLPRLAGLIVNLSSPESRVSLQDYLADHGKEIDLDAWLKRMINAFHTPLSKADKRLYIRDFAYTKELQAKTLSVIDDMDAQDLGASIKITAHDYFPRFPNNEIAYDVRSDKLIELEAYGEHMGWGLIPNCRVGEFVDRYSFVESCGAAGAFIRISWEAMTGPHALEGLSDMNVYALSWLAQGKAKEPDVILKNWLHERYGLAPDSELADILPGLLLESWDIVAEAYWDDKVFPRHSRLPASWEEGWHSALTAGMGNRLLDEQAGIDSLFEDEAAIGAFIKQKEDMVEKAQTLYSQLCRFEAQIKEADRGLWNQLNSSYERLVLYARMFALAYEGTIYAATASQSHNNAMRDVIEGFDRLILDIEKHLKQDLKAPHTLGILFDTEHIKGFVKSLNDQSLEMKKTA